MCRRLYHRRFSWPSYPSGFFPRLLLRLQHLRVRTLISWLDAAVITGRDGTECAFLKLSRLSGQNKYCLEVVPTPPLISPFCLLHPQVQVKVETVAGESAEPLISELSYVISRLHRDMFMLSRGEVPMEHEVLVSKRLKTGVQDVVCLSLLLISQNTQ